MTLHLRKIFSSVKVKQGIKLACRNTSLKNESFYMSFVCASNFSSGEGRGVDFQKEMWKRLKKNDPEMDHYLSAVYTKDRIKDLSRCMDCSVEEATELVKRDSPLGVTDFDRLKKRIELLKTYNFTAKDIISNPSVLHRTYEVLERRLAMLKILKCPPNEISLSVLKKSDTEFKILIEKRLKEDEFLSLFSSRQNCLAVLFDCEGSKAKELIDEHSLMTVSPFLLKSKIDILKRFHFPSIVIQSNIRAVINTSTHVMESRLQQLKDESVIDSPYLRLGYMLSCNDKDFKKTLCSLKENTKALEGCKNKKEYLMFRLRCSNKVAEGLINKKPISTMSGVKLQKMLDFFLMEMKASSDFIISNVSLLGFSIERMHRRWPIICESNFRSSKMVSKLLSMSDEDFDKLSGDADSDSQIST